MYETTMTGSFFRTKEIEEQLRKSSTGEIDNTHDHVIRSAESLAISDQLHPLRSKSGLTWVRVICRISHRSNLVKNEFFK